MSTNSDKISEIQRLAGVEVDGLWGPKTRAAVASELGCQPNNASIQETVGTTADGIIGSRTLTAILEKFRIKHPS